MLLSGRGHRLELRNRTCHQVPVTSTSFEHHSLGLRHGRFFQSTDADDNCARGMASGVPNRPQVPPVYFSMITFVQVPVAWVSKRKPISPVCVGGKFRFCAGCQSRIRRNYQRDKHHQERAGSGEGSGGGASWCSVTPQRARGRGLILRRWIVKRFL